MVYGIVQSACHSESPAAADAGADAAEEAGVDAAQEAGVDAAEDAGADAAGEASLDAATEASVDAAEPAEAGPWTVPADWRATPEDEDPFRSDVSDPRPCAATEYGPEPEGAAEPSHFEVSTETCNYATFSQPSQRALSRGEEVELALWHYPLRAEEAATAQLRVRVADETIVRWEVPIPAEASALTRTWTAPHDVPAGTLVYFHVHNHGINSWRIGKWATVGVIR